MSVTFSTVKDFADIAQAIAIIIASIVAGYWTLRLYRKRRQSYPRAIVEHNISHTPTLNGKVLLNVITTISNIGDVLIRLKTGQIWVYQMLPPKADLLDIIKTPHPSIDPNRSIIIWEPIGKRLYQWDMSSPQMEPGEKVQITDHFVIESGVQRIYIFTHLDNVEVLKRDKRDVGWQLNTFYNLQTAKDIELSNGIHSSNGVQSSWLKRLILR